MKTKKVINISFDSDGEYLYEKIQFITNSSNINRSGFIRHLLKLGLDNYETRDDRTKTPIPLY